MTRILLIALAAFSLAVPAFAQDLPRTRNVSFDFGLGAQLKPTYPGSDDLDIGPWVILRNLSIAGADGKQASGFALTPSLGYIGPRDTDDDFRLDGLDDIDRAYEIGIRASYYSGPATFYTTARKGFGGHHGLTGETGVKYRIDQSDRLTLWAGFEAGYGNGDFNRTYYGVSDAEDTVSPYDAYSPGGGLNSAAAKLEARYTVSDNTALMGEVKIGRVIGDAADSPVVLDKNQPVIKLGIVRKLNFGF